MLFDYITSIHKWSKTLVIQVDSIHFGKYSNYSSKIWVFESGKYQLIQGNFLKGYARIIYEVANFRRKAIPGRSISQSLVTSLKYFFVSVQKISRQSS